MANKIGSLHLLSHFLPCEFCPFQFREECRLSRFLPESEALRITLGSQGRMNVQNGLVCERRKTCSFYGSSALRVKETSGCA